MKRLKMKRGHKRSNRRRQLSLFQDDLRSVIGVKGWSIVFREKEDGPIMTAVGTLRDVYDALDEWKKEFPTFFSACIYRPSGGVHRMYP